MLLDVKIIKVKSNNSLSALEKEAIRLQKQESKFFNREFELNLKKKTFKLGGVGRPYSLEVLKPKAIDKDFLKFLKEDFSEYLGKCLGVSIAIMNKKGWRGPNGPEFEFMFDSADLEIVDNDPESPYGWEGDDRIEEEVDFPEAASPIQTALDAEDYSKLVKTGKL